MPQGLAALTGAPQDPGHVVVPVAQFEGAGVLTGVGDGGDQVPGATHQGTGLGQTGAGHQGRALVDDGARRAAQVPGAANPAVIVADVDQFGGALEQTGGPGVLLQALAGRRGPQKVVHAPLHLPAFERGLGHGQAVVAHALALVELVQNEDEGTAQLIDDDRRHARFQRRLEHLGRLERASGRAQCRG